jgi:glycosyltransferase involved in cell wall biosynthesis
MSSKTLYIVWFKHARRAETLAAELDGKVKFIYEPQLKGLWLAPLRYLVQAWKTWSCLERERPEVVLVQSPPFFAPLVVVTWCKLRGPYPSSGRGLRCAIDCHPATWYDPKWRWALPLLRMLSRWATVTLCTNEGAQDIIRRWKVQGFFLSDGLPNLSPATSTIGSEGETRVAVIGSLDTDEPVAEVFTAARLLPHVTFYVTGDSKRVEARVLAQKPRNVIMTGFLLGGDYTALLKNVHGLVVLTNVTRALNCAAYEAVAVGKPAISSDWLEMRHGFSRGFIHVVNTPEAIAAGVQKMLEERELLAAEIAAMGMELVTKRKPRLEELMALLQV